MAESMCAPPTTLKTSHVDVWRSTVRKMLHRLVVPLLTATLVILAIILLLMLICEWLGFNLRWLDNEDYCPTKGRIIR